MTEAFPVIPLILGLTIGLFFSDSRLGVNIGELKFMTTVFLIYFGIALYNTPTREMPAIICLLTSWIGLMAGVYLGQFIRVMLAQWQARKIIGRHELNENIAQINKQISQMAEEGTSAEQIKLNLLHNKLMFNIEKKLDNPKLKKLGSSTELMTIKELWEAYFEIPQPKKDNNISVQELEKIGSKLTEVSFMLLKNAEENVLEQAYCAMHFSDCRNNLNQNGNRKIS